MMETAMLRVWALRTHWLENRVTQADLRRAVSTAYCAVFHFCLIEAAERAINNDRHRAFVA
jgi:hypothetical protein